MPRIVQGHGESLMIEWILPDALFGILHEADGTDTCYLVLRNGSDDEYSPLPEYITIDWEEVRRSTQ